MLGLDGEFWLPNESPKPASNEELFEVGFRRCFFFWGAAALPADGTEAPLDEALAPEGPLADDLLTESEVSLSVAWRLALSSARRAISLSILRVR